MREEREAGAGEESVAAPCSATGLSGFITWFWFWRNKGIR
jgi:hypothetical protein